MNTNGQTMKTVFTVVDRGGGKSYWTRVGIGFVNRDGSLNLRLDAIPTNGTLHVRDYEDPRDVRSGDSTGPAAARARPRPAEADDGRKAPDALGGLA
jgi:hypothetical protein